MNALTEILISFTKIGLVALGGGNSMLKLLEYEAVSYRHWLSPEEFIAMVGSTFLFPGLTGVKLAALIGYRAAGTPGLLLAVLCINLPGLLLTLVGYSWLSSHNSPISRKIMIAVQYGALALLAAAAYSLAEGVIASYKSYSIGMATFLFFIGLAFFDLSPIWGFFGFIGLCFFLVQ